jgi:hypothetical protein
MAPPMRVVIVGIACLMSAVAVLMASRAQTHFPEGQRGPTVREVRPVGVLGLVMKGEIESFDAAASDSGIYLVMNVGSDQPGHRYIYSLWIWHLNNDGSAARSPLRLAETATRNPRILVNKDSVFVAYATDTGMDLFASALGSSDWRSRTLLTTSPGRVSGLTWTREVGHQAPSLLFAMTIDNPIRAIADTAYTKESGLYRLDDIDSVSVVTQLVSAPLATGRQCEPVSTNAGLLWATTEFLGRNTSEEGIAFRTPVTRIYWRDSSAESFRLADKVMFPFATGATAIARDQQLVGLLISNGLVVYRKTSGGNFEAKRSHDVVDPRWLGMCQSIAIAQRADTTLIAWIDGRNQVDPTRKLGLMSVLRDQGRWPNADVYLGWLTGTPDHLRIVTSARLTKGTPMVRDLRMVQTKEELLLFWSGKINLAPENPDQMFVARI